ncbi:MAG TPA: GTPase ObgE [Longimicrobiales bacterium]|nr:GTPase ObgE [Longimicrobiales bacterium]
MFVDYVEIEVEAGVGGSGAEAWRREMAVPRGGPFGGDGGKGGDVVLVVDPQLTTLLDYRYRQHYKAERGEHGQGKLRTGRGGADLALRVPPGTVVKDANTGEVLGEMIEPGRRLVVATGGRGGRGNAAFATPTHRSPREWEPGAEGEQRRIALELKLIADVGLVGQPNAGKSTLLSVVTAARPKIADYPFTTLSPNLGVAELSGSRTFVVADLPGIIEGASEGKGLGHRFLRHIERTRALALLIPVDSADPQAEYEGLRAELDAYSTELASRPHCVVFTKADVLGPDDAPPGLEAPDAWRVFTISSVTGAGVPELLEELWRHVQDVLADTRAREAVEEEEPWQP